jgi:hypothetical protein
VKESDRGYPASGWLTFVLGQYQPFLWLPQVNLPAPTAVNRTIRSESTLQSRGWLLMGHEVGWRRPGWRLVFFLLAAVSTASEEDMQRQTPVLATALGWGPEGGSSAAAADSGLRGTHRVRAARQLQLVRTTARKPKTAATKAGHVTTKQKKGHSTKTTVVKKRSTQQTAAPKKTTKVGTKATLATRKRTTLKTPKTVLATAAKKAPPPTRKAVSNPSPPPPHPAASTGVEEFPFYNGGGMYKVPLADPTVNPNLPLNLRVRSNTFYNSTNTTVDPTAGQLCGGGPLPLLQACTRSRRHCCKFTALAMNKHFLSCAIWHVNVCAIWSM